MYFYYFMFIYDINIVKILKILVLKDAFTYLNQKMQVILVQKIIFAIYNKK